MLRTLASLAAGACLLTASTAAAQSTGAAIDIGRIEIEEELTPGGSYRLPALGVRNPSDGPQRYRMTASSMEGEEAVPEEWFRFEPVEFELEPGARQVVTARIVLPTGADAGDYVAIVGPQVIGGTDVPGAVVGVGAGARVTFAVEHTNALAAWWERIKRFFTDYAPWSYVVPALLAGALLVRTLRRRFRLTVERRA